MKWSRMEKLDADATNWVYSSKSGTLTVTTQKNEARATGSGISFQGNDEY